MEISLDYFVQKKIPKNAYKSRTSSMLYTIYFPYLELCIFSLIDLDFFTPEHEIC